MKGDYSRLTFDQKKHYSGVRMQQGRVQLDADWNEQVDILLHRLETEVGDFIGTSGVPGELNGGRSFAISVSQSGDRYTLSLAPGRYYIRGRLFESDAPLSLPIDELLPRPKAGRYLAYLDAWQSSVSAAEDPELREVALGGPDTATRVKNVWRVRLQPLEKNQTIDDSWGPAERAGLAGSMELRRKEGAAALGNQLYRVEIHQGGEVGQARYKWSRDNGAVVAQVRNVRGNVIELASAPRDSYAAFHDRDWVELLSLEQAERGEPGEMVRLQLVNGATLMAEGALVAAASPSPYQIVRRWDGAGIATLSEAWAELEAGLELRFAAGDARYHAGDYWLIPTRTSSQAVDWPAGNDPQPPHGVRHDYVPLAVLELKKGEWSVAEDLRRRFWALDKGAVSKQGDTVEGSLQVKGELAAWALKTTLYTAGGSAPLQVPSQNTWADFPELTATLDLPHAVNATVSYQIAMSGAGIVWQRLADLSDEQIIPTPNGFAIDHQQEDVLYLCTPQGLQSSKDGGATWQTMLLSTSGQTPTSGQASTNGRGSVNGVAVNPRLPSNIFASTAHFLFVSHDGGTTWAETGLGGFLSLERIVFDPADEMRLYACTSNGLFRKTNPESPWHPVLGINDAAGDRNSPLHTMDLVIHPTNSYKMYCTTEKGLFRSDDLGASWHQLSKGLPTARVRRLAIDPKVPQSVYVTLDNTAEGTLFRSDDEGNSWTRLGDFAKLSVVDILIDPEISSTLYVATVAGSYGLHRSDDRGETWSDAGLWSRPANNPDNQRTIHAMVFNQRTRTFYILMRKEGIWKGRPNKGTLATRLLVDEIEIVQGRAMTRNARDWHVASHCIVPLTSGRHTVKVQYRAPDCSGTNNPQGVDWHSRGLQVCVLGDV